MSSDPDFYKNMRFYSVNNDLEDIYRQWDSIVSPEEEPMLTEIVNALVANVPEDGRALERELLAQRKRLRASFRKSSLLHVYHMLVGRGELAPCEPVAKLLVKKSSKSQSGVLVITVLTSPYPVVDGKAQKFSCAWNCYYCPNEPGQPRSYLHEEPAVKRANENRFDPVLQFTDRAATLAMNGHPVDKIELLVLGGTWASYPHAYQEEFVRDLFFAANTFWERQKRPRRSLDEEQALNERTKVKIIGLTLETRPDTIDAAELLRLRRYGCTRVQLGVQHTDEAVLKKINRGHSTAETARALARLKDACFKVCGHPPDPTGCPRPACIHAGPRAHQERMRTDRAACARALQGGHPPDAQPAVGVGRGRRGDVRGRAGQPSAAGRPVEDLPVRGRAVDGHQALVRRGRVHQSRHARRAHSAQHTTVHSVHTVHRSRRGTAGGVAQASTCRTARRS